MTKIQNRHRAGHRGISLGLLMIVSGILAFSGVGIAGSGGGSAAAPADLLLIMVEERGCPYCELWNRDIGVIYDKTPEGRFAPLRRFNIGSPEIAHLTNVHYTPTFIVVRGGREIGRIIGYPGEDFFWPMLDEILEKAGFGRDIQRAPLVDQT